MTSRLSDVLRMTIETVVDERARDATDTARRRPLDGEGRTVTALFAEIKGP
jgi:hypothetical protein